MAGGKIERGKLYSRPIYLARSIHAAFRPATMPTGREMAHKIWHSSHLLPQAIKNTNGEVPEFL